MNLPRLHERIPRVHELRLIGRVLSSYQQRVGKLELGANPLLIRIDHPNRRADDRRKKQDEDRGERGDRSAVTPDKLSCAVERGIGSGNQRLAAEKVANVISKLGDAAVSLPRGFAQR